MNKIFLSLFLVISLISTAWANNAWYSTLQGAASDVDQTPPPNGVTIAYNTTDHEWEFNYGLAPAGGTTGTCLEKNSNSDYDYSWVTCSGGGSGLTVGTTTIANGTNGDVEYNNNGVLGEESVGGTGTVTSVTFTGDGIIDSSTPSSAVTASGTVTATALTQAKNIVLAGPSSGSNASPTFRALIGADLPNPAASTLGGVESIAAVSHNFLTSISTSGVPAQAQPAQADITGLTTGSSPTFTGLTLSGLTASEIVGTDSSSDLVSLATSTYPSLTELSYVKGVTSAIQTQLNAKQASGSYITALTGDVTASGPGSSSASVVKVNGLAVPTSKTIVGTNSSGQFIDASSSTLANNTSGNAGTATALAANGTNCSSGHYPLGVDASGNSESCTAAPTECSTSSCSLNSATTASTQATGDNTTSVATDAFVQSQIAAQVDMHDPVQAASTTALILSPTYNNGSSGVGATLTAGTVGVLVIDGYTPNLGDRVLVQNQAASLQNGCYTLTTVGVVITTDYVLTRCTDFNQASNIEYGDTFPVLQGSTNANQQFTMNNSAFTTVGAAGSTGNITFAQTSGGSQLQQGTNIVITGNSIATTLNPTFTNETLNGLLNLSHQNPTLTQGINWQSLAVLNTNNINWENLNFTNLGLNWQSITNLGIGNVNWNNLTLNTFGVNWDTITNLGQNPINWDNLTMQYFGINWTGFKDIGGSQSVNWADVSVFANFSPRPCTTASSTTPSIPVGAGGCDVYNITALSGAITTITFTGSPTEGMIVELIILDNGTARAITYGAGSTIVTAGTLTAPTTTVISTPLREWFQYHVSNTTWYLVGYA